MPRTHYVYVSYRKDTCQFYIGSRSSYSIDDGYYGSGVWPKAMLELGILLEKEVVKTCDLPNKV
jgi:hypothetical protein